MSELNFKFKNPICILKSVFGLRTFSKFNVDEENYQAISFLNVFFQNILYTNEIDDYVSFTSDEAYPKLAIFNKRIF